MNSLISYLLLYAPVTHKLCDCDKPNQPYVKKIFGYGSMVDGLWCQMKFKIPKCFFLVVVYFYMGVMYPCVKGV